MPIQFSRMLAIALGSSLAAIVLLALSSSGASVSAGMQNGSRVAKTTPSAGVMVASTTPTANPITSTGKIAFEGNYCSGNQCQIHIFTINPDGTGRTDISNSGLTSNNVHPSWSPDGTRIVFNRVIFGNPDAFPISIMNADGSGLHDILTSAYPSGYGEPDWGPEGINRIAYTYCGCQPGQSAHIWVANTDGSNPIQLTSNDPAVDQHPSWSPDGTHIAFDSTRAGPNTQIFVMNADGTHVAQLTTTGANSQPAWSRDGTRIAFERSGQIYIMNADGSNQHNISNNAYGDDYPAWTPAGGIGFNRGGQTAGIYTMNADGSNQQHIPNTGSQDLEPSWTGPVGPVVKVVDESQAPLPNAEVYLASVSDPTNFSELGTTDADGTVALPRPLQGDHIVARFLVNTAVSNKGSHNGWAYHVYLTNVDQNTDGTQADYTITDPSLQVQTVTIKKSDPEIGLNIMGSVEYNATTANLQDIAAGLTDASKLLLDVTDGQMFFEKVTLYDDGQNFQDADIQYLAWPLSANAGNGQGPHGLTDPQYHMQLSGPGYNGLFWTGSWQQPIAYTLLDKIFGYYGIGAYSETDYVQHPECSTDYNAQPLESRASLMAQGLPIVSYRKVDGTPEPNVIDPVFFTEFCNDSDHSHNPTAQETTLHESVWATFVRNWSDPQNRWTLVSPMIRGAVDPGPSNPTTLQEPTGAINIVSPETCGPFVLRVIDTGTSCVSPPPSGGTPLVSVILHHNGRDIFEGYTGSDGTLLVYGAVPGDVIEAINPTGYASGKTTISACQTSVLVICNGGGPQPQPLLPDPHVGQDSVDLHFHVPGGLYPTQAQTYGDASTLNQRASAAVPAAAPTVFVSQDGGAQQPVTLTYDPSTQNYSGTFVYTTAIATDFSLDVKATDPTSPTNTTTNLYRMVLAQYHTGGPQELVQLPRSKAPTTPPTSWDVFPPDNFVGLTVFSSTLPDGTGVVGSESSLTGLAPAPNSLMAVGGPYDINGEHPINITATLSLAYQSEYYCGLQQGGAGIYKYTGSGWDLLPTTMNFSGNHAFATITQWGTYAVFAQPNAPATFSDVPSGSTYHDYIEWMACHGIASGYSDGTFRPNNNATRGQISKMVVLAYNWDQEPPANGGYSFTDVPVGSTFFTYVEAAYRMGVFSGYPCGGAGEPCDSRHRPYFRPGANVTRGQIAKILSNAAIFTDQPTGQTFTDVPVGSTFYAYVGRMASRGIIGGYPCGGAGEPCDSQHRPYFRPGYDATRGQLSKMIYLTTQPR